MPRRSTPTSTLNPARRLVRSRLVLALLWLAVAAQQVDFAAHAAMRLRTAALGALFGDVCTAVAAADDALVAPTGASGERVALAGADCKLCLTATMAALPWLPAPSVLAVPAAAGPSAFTAAARAPLPALRLPQARAPPPPLA
jgi:hypothetical protein